MLRNLAGLVFDVAAWPLNTALDRGVSKAVSIAPLTSLDGVSPAVRLDRRHG